MTTTAILRRDVRERVCVIVDGSRMHNTDDDEEENYFFYLPD